MNPYVGEIRMYAGTRAPENWVFCDGSLLDINQWMELYSHIGTNFGGDGQSNFAVPDMRGRVPVHVGTGASMSEIRLAQMGGYETLAVDAKYMSGHTHAVYGTKTVGTSPSPVNAMMAATIVSESPPKIPAVYIGAGETPAPTPSAMNALTVAPNTNAGNPVTVNLVQPYLTINYIISLKGVY
ncbi:tail fiber protein [Mucilaginibacter sp. dw_454]|uniref:phage tail protein n=1 Tax=Mucilaginibacter sp. dw_454 TaxID=2720079 RepID=UPI001BD27041|nr:tail fiber protein [Mucilaginibacter sp. dw_454]